MTTPSSPTRNALLPWTAKRQLLVAFICLIGGFGIFTIALLGMLTGTGLGHFDQPVLDWMVQHRTPAVTLIMQFITMIASPIGFAAILTVAAVLWAWISREIWRPFLLVGSTGIAALTAVVLKRLFVHQRPPHAVMMQPFEIDYSFPSGHTIAITTCVLVVGYLICSRRSSRGRIAGWVSISIVGITLVGGSRLYLGYHWLTDVVASIGLGLIILAFVIVIDKLFART